MYFSLGNKDNRFGVRGASLRDSISDIATAKPELNNSDHLVTALLPVSYLYVDLNMLLAELVGTCTRAEGGRSIQRYGFVG
jgi:hypothetical protein